jgi:hypothetical protein
MKLDARTDSAPWLQPLARREFLRFGLAGLGTLSLPGLLRLRSAAGATQAGERTALLVVWLHGGASPISRPRRQGTGHLSRFHLLHPAHDRAASGIAAAHSALAMRIRPFGPQGFGRALSPRPDRCARK